MVIISPHPTEELLLIREQKKLIAGIFEAGKIIYAHTPLWIPTDFKSVEQAKSEINKITIFKPEYDENQKNIICPVKIETVGGKVLESKLDFIICHCEEQSDVAIHVNDGTFPLCLKIFRLGECTSTKPGVYELSSVVWKKLTS